MPIKILLLLFSLYGCNFPWQQKVYRWKGSTMGTTFSVIVDHYFSDDKEWIALKREITGKLKLVNKQMSTWDVESEISQFNQSRAYVPFTISHEFYEVVQLAQTVYKKTNGAFDPTIGPLVNLWGFGPNGKTRTKVPDSEIRKELKRVGFNLIELKERTLLKSKDQVELDLSAIAKGFGVDEVAKVLRSKKIANFMVEIGGEIVTAGLKNEKKWRIGIDSPELGRPPGEKLEKILKISDIAMATSGDYRNFYEWEGKKYSHTIDPKTGRPVQHKLAAVTVMAASCVLADAYATSVMVMGEEAGMKFLEGIPGVEGLLVIRSENGRLIHKMTKGMMQFL